MLHFHSFQTRLAASLSSTWVFTGLVSVLLLCAMHTQANAADEKMQYGTAKGHPRLIYTQPDVKAMKQAIAEEGNERAFVFMRNNQALVFKATAQGLGHGQFDKLGWLFYDNGNEIINDYAAERFLNVEAKYGGYYLPENDSYAKQTLAHNTLVEDEISHFNAETDMGNRFDPQLAFFAVSEQVQIAKATMDNAYKGVSFSRTQTLINTPEVPRPFVIDVLKVTADRSHQDDLPVQYNGQIMDTNFSYNANIQLLTSLGQGQGYKHLWLTGKAQPTALLAKVTWLNKGRFYTHSRIVDDNLDMLFTQTGANDPNVNLPGENAFILRIPRAKQQQFVSMLELHGKYDPSKEVTLTSHRILQGMNKERQDKVHVIGLLFKSGVEWVSAFSPVPDRQDPLTNRFIYTGKNYQFSGRTFIHKVADKA